MINRQEIISAIEKHRIIVIARGLSREELLQTAEAMYRGGIRLMEVTFNACATPSDEETAANIALLSERFQGKMYVGAGTVLRPEQVELAAKAGAAYIISPDSRREVIERTRELGLVSLPGAFTPTECTTAWDFGADFIKIFPNSELKPSYIKALKAPLSHMRFLAVGGVDLDNLHEFMQAGACGIGIATGIIDKKLVKAGDYDGITELARRFTEKMAQC
ncbi:MAG: bifunctional 4-hydroxy-2-oxoglutarate aldolase/2-dehydro-3-deoxy-phosphogluconate aldolase [Ruminococcaceae bacterium]|nr:bifunctional 4-hydroxy-2-oxoglutarate aldolase/2-dehydro-3-deoxy-phosphogluconate aldolase [Oscillospiraceae bacterium]